MSEMVLSFGWIAPLVRPITEEKRETFEEDYPGLKVNYEGTLIYNDEGAQCHDNYYEIVFSNRISQDKFEKEVVKSNNYYDSTKLTFYSCNWYNGADAPMDTLTLEEYVNTLAGKNG